MNAGLVALLLKSLIESKLGPLLELSWVEGASQFQFIRAVWGMLRRDLYGILLFVFALCFTSFSIPLIAGGGRATTLEILIYEKIRISGAWSEALSLSLIQLVAVMAFSLIPFSPRKKLFGRSQQIPLLGSWSGLLLLGFYCLGLGCYFLIQSLTGWEQVLQIPGLWEEAFSLLPLSFVFSISVGLLVGALLLLVTWVYPFAALHRLISGIVSPSTALLGFSLLFLFAHEEPWNYVKWIFGFVYLVFATLYRWGWDQELSGLSDQVQVAETLGGRPGLIFRQILLPQLWTPLVRISSVASLWALGDFALGRILISQNVTLALLIETLMSSYRLPAALALMGLLLVAGAVCFLFFWGLSYVGRRAFE